MNQEQLERAKRHLGGGGYLEITNPDDGEVDKFYMEKLPVWDEGSLLYAAGKIQEGVEETDSNSVQTNKIFENLSKMKEEDYQILADLGYKSLKNSPELEGFTEDEKKQFVISNFIPVVMRMLDIGNMGVTKVASGDAKVIKRVREIRRMREQNGSSTPSQ